MLAFLAGYTPPLYIHTFFLVIVAILMLQVIYQNKTVGLMIGVLCFLCNLYFMGAVLSEFTEFTEMNTSAWQLIVVGTGIWMVNLVMASVMIYKNVHVAPNDSLELNI